MFQTAVSRRFSAGTLGLVLGMVAAANAVAGTLSLQETFEDKVSKSTCTEYQTGRFSSVLSFSSAADFSSFNTSTPVIVTIGDFSLNASLGAACAYKAGDTTAHIQQVSIGELASDTVLSWGNGTVTAVVRGWTGDPTGNVGHSPAGQAIETAGIPGAGSTSIPVSIQFPSIGLTLSGSVPVSGSMSEKTKQLCGSPNAIDRVKINGSTTAP